MRYDFTSIIDRQGMDATALELDAIKGWGLGQEVKPGAELIPMWVADMNFAACPAIVNAMSRRVQHPLYGYFPIRGEYYDAIIGWQTARNRVTGLAKECIGYENGVLGGVISALNVLCSKGDKVLVHSPTYIGFTSSLSNNGYRIVHSPLYRDGQGVWRMDLADMEQKIIANRIHAMVFCSPHNPCGRVWERGELEEMVRLCEKYDVKIVSDEIWSDIIRPGFRHIPTQMASEWARQNTVALYAPSKTFNLAGLIGAYHIIYNPTLRDRVEKESSLCHYNDINVLSMHALIGAYGPEGAEWCDELCQTIAANVDHACGFIAGRFEGVSVFKPQGTYMLFLDCTEWCKKHKMSIEELLKAGIWQGVLWQPGTMFHGPCHIRMNLALPLSRVREAFDRLDKFVFNA